jgi:hypothetical protein
MLGLSEFPLIFREVKLSVNVDRLKELKVSLVHQFFEDEGLLQ